MTVAVRLRHMAAWWLGLVLVAGPLTAALPISYYLEKQAEAPEFLQVALKSVSTRKEEDFRWEKTHFTVQAEVLSVARSKSGLKPGDVITIRYTRSVSMQQEPGAQPNPSVESGQKLPAYLSKAAEGEVYSLAAGAYSFQTLGRKAP